MVPADLVPSGLLLASFFLCHHMVKEREREIEARTEEKREGGKERERKNGHEGATISLPLLTGTLIPSWGGRGPPS